MQNLHRIVARLSQASLSANPTRNGVEVCRFSSSRSLSSASGSWRGGNDNNDGGWGKPGSSSGNSGWDRPSSRSSRKTEEQHFGEVNDRSSGGMYRPQSRTRVDLRSAEEELLDEFNKEMQKGKKFSDQWKSRFQETCELVKQIREPGVRGAYLKDSEKAEIYRLHKEAPEVNSVEKLAKDSGILRQRVHAIIFLKELEEEVKKLGRPLDECVEKLLDNFPEFFQSHDQEFHVASLSHKPDFKVMPEDWDGTTRDVDEVHFEISQREDEALYQDFVNKLNFIKKKVAGEVYSHKYSRRRPSDGWKFTVEKLGARGKRGGGGGWKFVTLPDGSSRPLNETEKMFLKRETPRPSRRVLAPYRSS